MRIRTILLTIAGCLLLGAVFAHKTGSCEPREAHTAARLDGGEVRESRMAAQYEDVREGASRALRQDVDAEKLSRKAADAATREDGQEMRSARGATQRAGAGEENDGPDVQNVTAGAEPPQYQGAHLRLDVATHDFGDVPRKGGDLEREFTYTNDGSVPLVLTRVITSCSCIKASFSKRPVPPGGTGVIRIIYEPLKSEPGAFNKVIQVYSNSVDGRDVITVQGNSIDARPRKLKNDKMKIKY